MVNADRVKRKLPSLLCSGPTTDKKEWAKRHRIEIGLKRLKKRNPEKYHILETRLIRDLEEIEKAVSTPPS
jgi:hypothetical protein